MSAAGVHSGGGAPVRAGILVTGTEVLTGIITDRNGPWLSERLVGLGVDAAMIQIVGDRPDDLMNALRFMAASGMALVVTSGGLGPTADDLTAEIVGEFCGREMVLDEELEAKIAEILRPLMSRWRDLDPDAVLLANRKQAVVPAGATVLDPVGTAPGLVVPFARWFGADRRGLTGAPARAARDVGQGDFDRGLPRRDRGRGAVPPRHCAAVRHPGVRDRGDAASGFGGGRSARAAGDHDMPAARGDRGGHAL